MIKYLQHFNVKNNYAQTFFWGAIFVFTLIHIVIYVLMPYTCDDYWYMTPLRDYCMEIDLSFPADDLWECWTYHFYNDNIRLANIVFTFFLLIPKIIPSIISGLFVGVMLWLAAKVSGINGRNPLLMVILAFLLSFMLPWYEQMFTLCFAFNYIWASVLALWLVYIFFYKENHFGVVVSFLLGFIMGAWHEGFSVPLLVGFVTYMILRHHLLNRSRIAIMLGLVVGLLWLASAPGLQANVGYNTMALHLSTILSKLMLYHTPLVILLLSIFIAAIKKNSRKLLFDSVFIAYIVICFIGVALNLITNVGVRTGWMGYLFAIIATLYLWKNMKELRYGCGKPLLKRGSIIAIVLFLLVHYGVVIYYSIVVKQELEYVLSQYHKSSDGQVFADVTYDYQVLPLAWKKPYFENFTYNWAMYWKSKYYNDAQKWMRVIPTCLSNAENLNATKVMGDNPFMIYNGYLFAPLKDDESVSSDVIYEIDFGITKKRIKCSNFVFTTTEGNRYYFSFPQRATVHLWIGDIKEMNEVDDE